MSIPYRPDLLIREIGTSSGRVIDHVIEVENAGDIERIRAHLEPDEYDAALELRRLWFYGALNGDAGPLVYCSHGKRLRVRSMSDPRPNLNDELRHAMRAMGYCGMMASYVLDVVV